MYTLLVTGDVPGASTYFNPLLQQTIIPCTSGTRPTATHEGMTIYETDTDRLAKWTGAAWEYVAGTRAAVTPTLTATTTNPTLGTGSKAVGTWNYIPGPRVVFDFFIKFGSSGVNGGSGQYLVSLPVAAANTHAGDQPAMGSAVLRDDSAGSIQAGSVYVPGSNLNVCSIVYAGGGGVVGNTTPWTWANLDYLSGTITYPV